MYFMWKQYDKDDDINDIKSWSVYVWLGVNYEGDMYEVILWCLYKRSYYSKNILHIFRSEKWDFSIDIYLFY